MISRRDEDAFRVIMQDGWVNEKRKKSLRAWFRKWKREHDVYPTKLPDEETMTELYKVPIDTLGLTVRPYHGLRRQGVHTVGALLAMRENEVRDIRFIGDKAYGEIERVLALRGWRLAPHPIVSAFEKWLEGMR